MLLITCKYNGEVQIYQEELDRFLDVAQRLKLDGLMENGGIVAPKNEKIEEALVDTYYEEQKKYKSNNSLAASTVVGTIEMNSDDIKKIEEKIEEYIARDDQGLYKCTFCGKNGEKRGLI